jgi:AcrR family transcriptional regulator
MPHDTWWNLDQHKRDAILATALTEFAAHNYAQASLSAIVKSLGIAKGSMYQYFADKEDLYLYVVKWASDRMMQHLEQQIPLSVLAQADVFTILRHYFVASLSLVQILPRESALIQRAFLDSGPQRVQVQQIGADTQHRFVEELVMSGIANRSLRSTIAPEVYVFVLQTVIANVGTYLYQRSSNGIVEADAVQFFDQLISVLDHGMRYQLRI